MAAGVDIDGEALAWGAHHNGDALLGGSATEQLCLLHSNVRCRRLRCMCWCCIWLIASSSTSATCRFSCNFNHAPRYLGCLVQVLDDVKDAPRITAAVAATAVQPSASRDTAPDQSPAAEEGSPAVGSQTGGAAAEEAEAAAEREAQLREVPADVVASVNFSLCLLHTREDALRYLRLAHAAMQQQDGSIMVSRRSSL